MKNIRMLGFAAFAATALATGALAAAAMSSDDKIAATGGDIQIHAIHHAALTLSHGNQRILVDPAPAPGAQGGDPTAEYKAMPAPTLILITDVHGDHLNGPILSAVAGNATIVAPQAVVDDKNFPADLKAKTRVLANGASITVNGIQIEAVPMYNITQDRLQFHNKGRGNGYVLTIGGKRVYIAGDTEDIPEMRALRNIDVAFIPMNLPYTMDVQHAAQAVKAFKPKVVIPYHYGMSDVNQFKTLVGADSDVHLLKWY